MAKPDDRAAGVVLGHRRQRHEPDVLFACSGPVGVVTMQARRDRVIAVRHEGSPCSDCETHRICEPYLTRRAEALQHNPVSHRRSGHSQDRC